MKQLTLTLYFQTYQELENFIRQIRSGVSRPYASGYRWEEERSQLTPEQIAVFESHVRDRCVWDDPTTGLTWIYDLELAHGPTWNCSLEEWLEFGLAFKYSDWRWPRLDELKTLRRDKARSDGLFISAEIRGKFNQAYRSVTHESVHDAISWDFRNDRSWTDDSKDSSFTWNSSGSGGSWEGGRSASLDPKSILVRGQYDAIPAWLQAVREWADWNKRFDYPDSEDAFRHETSTVFHKDNFPPSVERLVALTRLSLEECTFIPKEVYDLPKLRKLHFKGKVENSLGKQKSPFVYLSENISQLSELEYLGLYSVNLDSIPEGIGALEKLKEIAVDCAQVKCIPASMGKLISLEKLRLPGSCLSEIPATLGALGRLRSIDLKSNELVSIPDIFGGLQALTELTLEGNKLLSLPMSIWSLGKLEFLNLDSNDLVNFPDCPDGSRGLRSLRTLLLDGNRLESLPRDLWALEGLETLYIGHNGIHEIPSEISRLKALVRLDLEGCPIAFLPESMLKLESLRELDISGTQITELPDWIWKMKSLRELRVRSMEKLFRFKKPEDSTVNVRA